MIESKVTERKVTGRQGTSSPADTVDSGVTSLSLGFPPKMCTKLQVPPETEFRLLPSCNATSSRKQEWGAVVVGGDYGILLCVPLSSPLVKNEH